MTDSDISKFCVTILDQFMNSRYMKLTLDNSNFQYINETSVKELITDCKIILGQLESDKSYLDIGTGIGMLQCINDGKFNIETVELETLNSGKLLYDVALEYLNVKRDYYMNDIRKKDFIIHNCNKKYDMILLLRFHPFNRCKSIEDVNTILEKLSVYSNTFYVWSQTIDFNDFIIKNDRISNVLYWDNNKFKFSFK
jgi:hypothetical protein